MTRTAAEAIRPPAISPLLPLRLRTRREHSGGGREVAGL